MKLAALGLLGLLVVCAATHDSSDDWEEISSPAAKDTDSPLDLEQTGYGSQRRRGGLFGRSKSTATKAMSAVKKSAQAAQVAMKCLVSSKGIKATSGGGRRLLRDQELDLNQQGYGNSKMKAAVTKIKKAKAVEKNHKSSYIRCCKASAHCTTVAKNAAVASKTLLLSATELNTLELIEDATGPGMPPPAELLQDTDLDLTQKGYGKLKGDKVAARKAMKGRSLKNTADAVGKAAAVSHNAVLKKLEVVAKKALKAKQACLAEWKKKNTSYKDFGIADC